MRKKSAKNKKRTVIIIVLLLIFLFIFIFFDIRINNSFQELSKYYCGRNASEIISTSVDEILCETRAEYSDFSTLIYDENGKVVSAETITANVNSIQNMIIKRINEKIAACSENKIEIPIGTVTGFYILNGRGPKASFKFIPSGNTETNLSSSFTSAGINQTCHKIILDVTVRTAAIYPGGKSESEFTMSCIIAETIIVGDIPESLLGINSVV